MYLAFSFAENLSSIGSVDGIPFIGLTAPGLLGAAILMLLTGRIIPRATLQDKQEESEKWRLAYEYERDARKASDAQTGELLEVAKTSHSVMVAVFETVRTQTGDRDALTKD